MRMTAFCAVRIRAGNRTLRNGGVDGRRGGIGVDSGSVVVVMAVVSRGLGKRPIIARCQFR